MAYKNNLITGITELLVLKILEHTGSLIHRFRPRRWEEHPGTESKTYTGDFGAGCS